MNRILERLDVCLSRGSGLCKRERREQQKQPGSNSPETSTEHVYSEESEALFTRAHTGRVCWLATAAQSVA